MRKSQRYTLMAEDAAESGERKRPHLVCNLAAHQSLFFSVDSFPGHRVIEKRQAIGQDHIVNSLRTAFDSLPFHLYHGLAATCLRLANDLLERQQPVVIQLNRREGCEFVPCLASSILLTPRSQAAICVVARVFSVS
jgi:hypothetical protein